MLKMFNPSKHLNSCYDIHIGMSEQIDKSEYWLARIEGEPLILDDDLLDFIDAHFEE